MIKTCEYCKKEFNAKRNSVKFCCFECSIPRQIKSRPKCKMCDNLVKTPKQTYCSHSCSHKDRKHSVETIQKISNKLKTSYHDNTGSKFTEYITFECPYCNTKTERRKSETAKTCGDKECIKIHQSKNTGGYREGSGRSKSGYYNGIYCGSTYELVWMMYNDAHSISYKRFEGFIKYGNGKRYFPDFIQDNKVIEIKGFHTDVVDIKKSATISAGYEIEILYKEDLKPMFNWFKKEHKGKSLVEMYDGHKPKFEYDCSCCGKYFGTEKERKTELKYCSNVCAGKHRAQIRKINW